MRLAAPAKLNLCLYLGPRRADGLHELVSLFEPLALSDEIEVAELPDGEGDEVLCPAVEGENLAARALAALRERGWDGPPLRLQIEKRIPVAAGLGGGSADAAAVLRLAAGGFPGEWTGNPADLSEIAARALAGLRERGWDGPPLRLQIEKRIPVAAGLGGGSADAAAVLRLAAGDFPGEWTGIPPDLPEIAARLGADVPSQLRPALALVRGAGERVEPLPPPPPHAVLLLPGGGGLSTAEVFAEADRLGLGRSEAELARLATRLREAAGAGASPLDYAELLANDLERAARSLRPDIGGALDALRAAGAPLVLLSGSGPTAVGVFDALAPARSAAASLGREDAIVCEAGQAP